MIEKSDSSYGMTNCDLYRTDRVTLNPKNYMLPGISKLRPADYGDNFNDFGKLIHKIKGNASQGLDEFGKIFYDSDGNPEVNGSSDFNKIVKQCDNIVILSRVKSYKMFGYNTGYSRSGMLVHRSIVSLESDVKMDIKYYTNPATNDKPTTYKIDSFNTKKSDTEIRNTIAHEFSHNYLSDEYSGNELNLNERDVSYQQQIAQDLKFSNLQTGYELKNSITNHDVDAAKIKWRWPRVKKIGVGIFTEEEDVNGNPIMVGIKLKQGTTDIYQCKIKTNANDATDKKNSFDQSEKILLRRRFLFDTEYLVCEVTFFGSPDANGIQEIEFKPQVSLNIQNYDEGFMIILPHWRNGTQDLYHNIVYHAIEEAMTSTNVTAGSVILERGRALARIDDRKNNEPQRIDPNFRNNSSNNNAIIKRLGNNTSLIVGLYAGGNDSYKQGLYHATGFCQMRGSKKDTPNKFCPVCSYILIDYLHPIKHPVLDKKLPKYR